MNLCRREYYTDAEQVEANFRLSLALASLESVQNIYDLTEDLAEKIMKSICNSIVGSLLIVKIRASCETVYVIAAKVIFGFKLAYQIAKDSVAIAEISEGNNVEDHALNNYEVWFVRLTLLQPGNLHHSLLELDAN